MPSALTWQSDERCVVGDTTFQLLPSDLLDRDQPSISMEGADFLLFKERPLIERYVELLEQLRPQHIFELGILEGGGTALLLELASPRRMVAIDRKGPTKSKLRDYISRKGLDQTVEVHIDVDQADRGRLAELAEEVFGGEPLDLVVDDCSHMYEATAASFSELFPRLRPGGLYVIEDWPWAHEQPVAGMWADQVPLTRLVVELVLAVPSVPGLISGVTIDAESVEVRRGDAEVDSVGFDIFGALDQTARSLLASDERADHSAQAPTAD